MRFRPAQEIWRTSPAAAPVPGTTHRIGNQDDHGTYDSGSAAPTITTGTATSTSKIAKATTTKAFALTIGTLHGDDNANSDDHNFLNSTSRISVPEIRARASGSRPTRQNLSPDLRIWARAGRAAISIPSPLFHGNHGIPENPLGYIHSKLKDFRDSQKIPLFRES